MPDNMGLFPLKLALLPAYEGTSTPLRNNDNGSQLKMLPTTCNVYMLYGVNVIVVACDQKCNLDDEVTGEPTATGMNAIIVSGYLQAPRMDLVTYRIIDDRPRFGHTPHIWK
jgi:hypothetical protein